MIGRRLRVHFNLRRHDFSVVDPTSGRVIANVDDITLDAVELRVQPALLARMRSMHRRKVCAYAIGTVVAVDTQPDVASRQRVTFNPWRADTFQLADTGEAVHRLDRAVFLGAYIWR